VVNTGEPASVVLDSGSGSMGPARRNDFKSGAVIELVAFIVMFDRVDSFTSSKRKK